MRFAENAKQNAVKRIVREFITITSEVGRFNWRAGRLQIGRRSFGDPDRIALRMTALIGGVTAVFWGWMRLLGGLLCEVAEAL